MAAPVPGPTPVTTATGLDELMLSPPISASAEFDCRSGARSRVGRSLVRRGSLRYQRRASEPACESPPEFDQIARRAAVAELHRTPRSCASREFRFAALADLP